MRLVFMGPPGAGKGTQAARLAEHFGVPHIATGDIFRRELESGTRLGKKAGEVMARGDLLPDEITNEIIAKRIRMEDAQKGFVLDGYPRTPSQAKVLDQLLEEMGANLDAVIKFMVTGDEIVSRLSGRRSCPVCGEIYHLVTRPPMNPGVCDNEGAALELRPDDSEESVRNRLEVYGQETKPLYDLYVARGIFREVDAIGSTEEVFQRLLDAIDSR